ANRYTITRTYRATDVCGNFAECSQIITVNDQTAPVLTCPANITTTTPIGFCTVAVSFAPTATDNCGGAVTITSVPASGSQFSIGTTLVTVTATDACGNASTCTFNVMVSDGQLPVISQHPVNRTVCAGTNATFSVTSTNAVSYQWQQYIGGIWTNITGQTSSSMTLNAVTHSMNTNTYRVNVVGLCTTVPSNAASLYVNPLPLINLAASVPPILLPGQTLTITATVSPAGGSFVWFKNNAAIPGATGSSLTGLTVSDIGTYRAEYTDLNGCRSISADLFVTAQPSGNLYVYPNPNTGVFRVRFFNQTNEPGSVLVYNENGARVYNQKFTSTLPYTSVLVDISRLAAGKYLVEVVNSAGRRIGAKWIIVVH
ncbi:MAG: HYR domain-containing protein, partial [Chitinophagaceae bacterium]